MPNTPFNHKQSQIPLDLHINNAYRPEDYFISTSNAPLIKALIDGPHLHPHILIQGAPGSGKTHLSHYLAHLMASVRVHAAEMTESKFADILENPQTLILDDADSLSEERLFHLCNISLANNTLLILLSRKLTFQWTPSLPDLASRLKAMRHLSLEMPDDALLRHGLARLFRLQAITPTEDCLDYLVMRMDRSLGAAQKTVTELIHYADGRAFTRALAKAWLEETPELPL